jgi:site-specific recombinase XerD
MSSSKSGCAIFDSDESRNQSHSLISGMVDELQRRNYSPNTVRTYIHPIEDFARYLGRFPFRLGPEHVRQYQVHFFRQRKLSAGTVEGRTAALRFLFVKTLKRPYIHDQIPFPKRQRPLPAVLSQDEVARLIDSAQKEVARRVARLRFAIRTVLRGPIMYIE